MIISKTPFRLSLFGGGTDFPSYYLKNGGCVVGGTINKYCYVTARYLPNVFDYKHRIVWSRNETVNNIREIYHPTVRSVFKFMNIKKGLEIHYQGDLQKNSGLGTSSAFCVGLFNALYNLENKKVSQKKLSLNAIHVEQKMLKAEELLPSSRSLNDEEIMDSILRNVSPNIGNDIATFKDHSFA